MGEVSVIDWVEAMQQCGDDEEFLRELLVDLRTEAQTQITNINNAMAAGGNPFEPIMRSAHMLKGASANLMCTQMRMAALRLEEAARSGNHQGTQASFQELQLAYQNFFQFMQSIGL